MKKIILIVMLFTSSSVFACQALIERDFNFKQILVTKKAFVYGKQYDMEYTLAAIVWKESSSGMNRYNPNDPSAGAFQIHINNAIKYANIQDTPENRVLLSARLIEEFYLGAKYAVKNIKFWQRLYGDDWQKVWASYNAGYNHNLGASYASDITAKIKVIEQCNW